MPLSSLVSEIAAISGIRDGHRNRKSQKSLRFRCAKVLKPQNLGKEGCSTKRREDPRADRQAKEDQSSTMDAKQYKQNSRGNPGNLHYHGTEKHINFFYINFLAPTQNTRFGAHIKKFMCLISWEATQKRDPHQLFRGDSWGQKGDPKRAISATKILVYCSFPPAPCQQEPRTCTIRTGYGTAVGMEFNYICSALTFQGSEP